MKYKQFEIDRDLLLLNKISNDVKKLQKIKSLYSIWLEGEFDFPPNDTDDPIHEELEQESIEYNTARICGNLEKIREEALLHRSAKEFMTMTLIESIGKCIDSMSLIGNGVKDSNSDFPWSYLSQFALNIGKQRGESFNHHIEIIFSSLEEIGQRIDSMLFRTFVQRYSEDKDISKISKVVSDDDYGSKFGNLLEYINHATNYGNPYENIKCSNTAQTPYGINAVRAIMQPLIDKSHISYISAKLLELEEFTDEDLLTKSQAREAFLIIIQEIGEISKHLSDELMEGMNFPREAMRAMRNNLAHIWEMGKVEKKVIEYINDHSHGNEFVNFKGFLLGDFRTSLEALDKRADDNTSYSKLKEYHFIDHSIIDQLSEIVETNIKGSFKSEAIYQQKKELFLNSLRLYLSPEEYSEKNLIILIKNIFIESNFDNFSIVENGVKTLFSTQASSGSASGSAELSCTFFLDEVIRKAKNDAEKDYKSQAYKSKYSLVKELERTESRLESIYQSLEYILANITPLISNGIIDAIDLLKEEQYKYLNYDINFHLSKIGQAMQNIRDTKTFRAFIDSELLESFDTLRWIRNSINHCQVFDEGIRDIEFFRNDLSHDDIKSGERKLYIGEYIRELRDKLNISLNNIKQKIAEIAADNTKIAEVSTYIKAQAIKHSEEFYQILVKHNAYDLSKSSEVLHQIGISNLLLLHTNEASWWHECSIGTTRSDTQIWAYYDSVEKNLPAVQNIFSKYSLKFVAFLSEADVLEQREDRGQIVLLSSIIKEKGRVFIFFDDANSSILDDATRTKIIQEIRSITNLDEEAIEICSISDFESKSSSGVAVGDPIIQRIYLHDSILERTKDTLTSKGYNFHKKEWHEIANDISAIGDFSEFLCWENFALLDDAIKNIASKHGFDLSFLLYETNNDLSEINLSTSCTLVIDSKGKDYNRFKEEISDLLGYRLNATSIEEFYKIIGSSEEIEAFKDILSWYGYNNIVNSIKLVQAVERSDFEAMKSLLKLDQVHISLNIKGFSAIQSFFIDYPYQYSDIEREELNYIEKEFLKKVLFEPSAITEFDTNGQTLVHYLVEDRYTESLKRLKTINPNIFTIKNKQGQTPLEYAAVKSIDSACKLYKKITNIIEDSKLDINREICLKVMLANIPEVMEDLVSIITSSPNLILESSYFDEIPIFLAIKSGKINLLNKMIELTRVDQLSSIRDSNENSLLDIVCRTDTDMETNDRLHFTEKFINMGITTNLDEVLQAATEEYDETDFAETSQKIIDEMKNHYSSEVIGDSAVEIPV